MSEINVYDDVDVVTIMLADHVVYKVNDAIAANDRCSVALSGGSTPSALYSLLATLLFSGWVRWPGVHVFWGDERCVPPDHLDSNYRMARETLLDHVPIPAQNIHRIKGELPPEEAAAGYRDVLRDFFDSEIPRFDLVLLGMGGDGHIASLFPKTAALHEDKLPVVANYVEKLDSWRITLTPPAINAAANIAFMVAGAGKAERLDQVLNGTQQPDILPAQLVNPTNGELLWFVDKAAMLSP